MPRKKPTGPVERLSADIPLKLKRLVTAKAALEGMNLTEVTIQLYREYVKDFEVIGLDEEEDEETSVLALAA